MYSGQNCAQEVVYSRQNCAQKVVYSRQNCAQKDGAACWYFGPAAYQLVASVSHRLVQICCPSWNKAESHLDVLQSAVQVKQQHTCVDDVCLAVWITNVFGVKRPGREAVHNNAFCAKFKEAFNCISTSHYGFVTSCLIISFKLTKHSYTTNGFKAPVIFIFMLRFRRCFVSFLCTQSFNFD